MDYLGQSEFYLIKQYIKYDDRINALLDEKENEIRKHKIDIIRKQQSIRSIEIQIEMIKRERDHSSVNSCHIFVNPFAIYDNMVTMKK